VIRGAARQKDGAKKIYEKLAFVWPSGSQTNKITYTHMCVEECVCVCDL